MSKAAKHSLLLLSAAFIWGVAFVAQSEGGDAMGPFSFNCIRNYIAFLTMIPITILFDKMGVSHKPETADAKKLQLKAGICTGIALFIASNLQQVGVVIGDSVGKAGFLTACYVVGVPVLGIFLKRKCGWNVWVGVALTVIGLYMLCIKGEFRLEFSDILILLCAFMFAVQIMIVDHFIPYVDGVRLSATQFLVTAILTTIPMLFFEVAPSAAGISAWIGGLTSKGAIIALLYAACISSGLGYTFQIIGQDGVNPTVASLLMSLESVFSVLAGWVLLSQALSVKELCGCALIFVAVVLAQLNFEKKKNKEE